MSAVRTTEGEVKDVMSPGNDYREGKPLRPFINYAHSLVDWVQANAADFGRSPNDDDPSTADNPSTARQLETWLAAWAYKASDQQLASSNAGRSSASFRGQSGKYLDMNNYGQMAAVLDGTGLLGALVSGTLTTAAWLGKSKADRLSWNERNWSTL
jgi:hypothetical protein